MGEKRVHVCRDSEVVINQVNDSYHTKHPKMRAYRNEVWDRFGNYFIEHKIKVIPIYENTVDDSLVVVAGKFKTPIAGQRKYKVDIVNRPSMQDNSKYWQVFEDEMQIKIFLELSGEFVNTHIDNKNDNFENFQDDEQSEGEQAGNKKVEKCTRRKGHNLVKDKLYPKRFDSLSETF